jgi:hypothetical protein
MLSPPGPPHGFFGWLKNPQIEATRWRGTLAGRTVTACEHLDQSWSFCYGPHVAGLDNGVPEANTPRSGKKVE